MPDARKLHEISEALRALQAKATEAGSPTARAILGMTAQAIHDMAMRVERERPAQSVAEMMRRLGDNG